MFNLLPNAIREILGSPVSGVEDRAENLCPRSHSWEVSEPGLECGLSDSGSWVFTSALVAGSLRGRV